MSLALVLGALPPDAARHIRALASAGALTGALATRVAAQVEDARVRPLAYGRLWTWPDGAIDPLTGKPRTSQRRSLAVLCQRDVIALGLLGGTGSGKSDVGAQFAVASALGRQDMSALDWCVANGIAPSVLPPRAGRVCASSQTFAESVQVVRKKLKKWLPAGSVWRNEFGPGIAEVALPGGGVILCKSNQETYTGFEADEYDNVWLDEEHDEAVFNAAKGRLGRRGWADGHVLNTMTPLQGKTWVWDAFVEAKPGDGHAMRQIYRADNPYLDQDFATKLFANLDPAERAARECGEFMSREGRVYAAWSREVHLWDGEPHPSWPRFQSCDWGTTNPTSIGHWAYDEGEDVLYRVDEVYERQLTIDQRAERITALGNRWGQPRKRWGDPADGATMASLRAKGIAIENAEKSIADGISSVGSRLASTPPRLRIHRRCTWSAAEFDGYRWDKEDRERPMKVDDHAMDDIRYGVVGIDALYRAAGEVRARLEAQSAALAGLSARPLPRRR